MPAENIPLGGQAALPNYRDKVTMIKDNLIAQKLSVLPPRLVVLNSVEAANLPTRPALDAKKGVAIRKLQNCGTRSVKWAIGMVPTADVFHGILAACNVADDGLGSVQDFSNIVGAIYVFDIGGNPRLATYEALAPEAGILNGTVGI
jgi:hypothetical protein